MLVRILSLSRSSKPNVLASVRLELADESTGNTVTIDDARVLRNKHGQTWLAMPCYSVSSENGRSYDYLPAVVLSTKLKRDVDDAVLAVFESWERESQGRTAGA